MWGTTELYGYYEPNGINEEERQKDIGETVSMASTLSLTTSQSKDGICILFDGA